MCHLGLLDAIGSTSFCALVRTCSLTFIQMGCSFFLVCAHLGFIVCVLDLTTVGSRSQSSNPKRQTTTLVFFKDFQDL